MDSDNSENIEERDQFANNGGDALNFDNEGMQDSEDVDEEDEDEDLQHNMRQESRKHEGSG